MGSSPRNRAVRSALTVVYALGFVGVPAFVQFEANHAFASDRTLGDSMGLAALLVAAAGLGCVLPLVGYRWRDCLLIGVPIYGFIFTLRMCWRLAGLPHQDWPVRHDSSVNGWAAAQPVDLSSGPGRVGAAVTPPDGPGWPGTGAHAARPGRPGPGGQGGGAP